MKASKILKNEIVNVINQAWNDDGSVDITMYKEGWKKSYKIKVKKLNTPDEEILEDNDIMEANE